MNSEEFIQAQRQLRSLLLDKRQAAVMRGACDLAAHLLLYLDNTEHCWLLTLEWWRGKLDADRADGGFANPRGESYRPFAESLRRGVSIPTSLGVTIDADDPALCMVWASSRAVAFGNVETDARFTARSRAQMFSVSTRSKLAVSLHDGPRRVGLICADWARERKSWNATQCQQISDVATTVLGPIFSTAYRAAIERDESEGERGCPASSNAVPDAPKSPLAALTPAELKVARLVVNGMSYKEIARELNRSFSTVDHRLRAIREKLGVSSTARLIRLFTENLPNERR
ncbi:MAG TPA: helix-turn-helix transcriptional regulator [Paucimonas sp.]|nr:helix-turn-helix transcriptional regulator [Paucimonas sp.]HJW55321.1 helix-turn-helix transcriptional regulator [Burkholderiaceae bacterium]